MMRLIHRAKERGGGDYGWLKTNYSFSFAGWYDPRRMSFGKLRVLNDDVIAPRGKFAMHGHQNFEIITIPLAGAVTHEDNLGNRGEVKAGEVQVMSAGTGIIHSEENASDTEALELFQIWIEPARAGVNPRYEQRAFSSGESGEWQWLVSDGSVLGTLAIGQRALIARAHLVPGASLAYPISEPGRGVYLMVVEGEATVAGETLKRRDAIGLAGVAEVLVVAQTNTELLTIEVAVR